MQHDVLAHSKSCYLSCRDTGRLLLRVLTVRAVQKMLAQLQVHA